VHIGVDETGRIGVDQRRQHVRNANDDPVATDLLAVIGEREARRERFVTQRRKAGVRFECDVSVAASETLA
jgi:hypothetical protein